MRVRQQCQRAEEPEYCVKMVSKQANKDIGPTASCPDQLAEWQNEVLVSNLPRQTSS